MPTVAEFIAEALAQVGKPYEYGGDGPNSFDCSGLVQYCLTAIGIKGCPRESEDQWAWCNKTSLSAMQPGVLIYEQWEGDNAPPGHVCIYLGDGKVIEAPHTGENVWIRSWSPTETTIVGYGLVPGLTTVPPPPPPPPPKPLPKPVTTVKALVTESNGELRVVCPKCLECFDVKAP